MLNSRVALWARQSPWARPLGVAAYRTWDRIRPSPPGPKVLVNAIPKAGTHLVMGLFDQVPGYRFSGQLFWVTEKDLSDDCVDAAERIRRTIERTKSRHYFMGHVMHHERVSDMLRDAGVPVITIVRDPRAIAASAVRYFEENRLRRRELAQNGFSSREELAQWLIDGEGERGAPVSIPPVAERVRQYIPWLNDPTSLVVRFEDLVGAHGGGSNPQQIATIRRILAFAGVEHLVAAETVAEAAYSTSSHTFSVGKVRSWESVLTPAQVAQVESESADAMEAFGYER